MLALIRGVALAPLPAANAPAGSAPADTQHVLRPADAPPRRPGLSEGERPQPA